MKILAKGKTKTECEKEIERKRKIGFEPISEIKQDLQGFQVRWVCVMSRPDEPGHKQRWNNFISQY
jgi:hypothetical protein